MRVTGTAQRDAWLAHAFPPVERAGPDLWSVPVPIPDSPLRYTLTYLVAAGGGLVVVDPGWDAEAGWQALAAGLKAAGASPADVTGIVVTHIHPDHHGLSAYLRSLELVAAYDQAEALPAHEYRFHGRGRARAIQLARGNAGRRPGIVSRGDRCGHRARHRWGRTI